MNYEQDTFYDQEIVFSYEGNEYAWQGDYSVTNWGDEESEFAPAYGETEVSIDHTTSLEIFNEKINVWTPVKPTPSLLAEVEIEIERNL